MREVKGYVFVGYLDSFGYIFGMRVNKIKRDGNYESLYSNGVIPYSTIEKASLGMANFNEVADDPQTSKLGKLEMEVAESAEEFGYFEGKDSLIVIVYTEIPQFLGPIVTDVDEGTPSFNDIGMELTDNNFRTFGYGNDRKSFDLAKFAVGEISRQVGALSTMATFNLKFVQ